MHSTIQLINCSGIERAFRVAVMKSQRTESKALRRSTFSIAFGSEFSALYPLTRSVASRTFSANSLPGKKADCALEITFGRMLFSLLVNSFEITL